MNSIATAKRNQSPNIEPPLHPDALPSWWQAWVDYVRTRPGCYDILDEQRFFWGEQLFIGCQTHKRLFRSRRAVGVRTQDFGDVVEYEDVSDLRAWQETKPAPLLLHEAILAEHCYIVGASGAGKTSLGIMPLLIQLIRGAKTSTDQLPEPYPVVILDLKGDAALFHTVKQEAEKRGQTFQFFNIEKDAPSYRFNPFRGFDRSSRTIAQLCQLIMDALSLNHGKGYGRSYYTERSRNVLSLTLQQHPNISSFDDLNNSLKATLSGTDSRTKAEAFELVSVIQLLTEYRKLITKPDEDLSYPDSFIFMPRLLEKRQVAYFWLPAALESISVGEIAKLALFNLRAAAQDWKRKHPNDPRRVILVIDELQHVAGENLRGILQDARSFGISAILANQSLKDLRSPTGFDLAPTIMTNTRAKFFFTSTSEHECYVFVERGKGFTAPRPFPERGNPWLRDLAPEEFAYHTRLAWPFSMEEYTIRDNKILPTWDEIPGGNYWLQANPATTVSTPPEAEYSDVLPYPFQLVQDDETAKQVASIQALFHNMDGARSYQDDAIDALRQDDRSFSQQEDEEDEEEDADY